MDTPITNLRNLMSPIVTYFEISEMKIEDEELIKIFEEARQQCVKNMPRILEILKEIPDDACQILNEQDELKILRDLLWKIGNAQIGSMKDGGKHLGEILSEIRYGYCYNQSNSYEGQTFEEVEQLRLKSLTRLNEI